MDIFVTKLLLFSPDTRVDTVWSLFQICWREHLGSVFTFRVRNGTL